jgi:23S rRNA (guanine2535-N1)-methyltransferase
MQYKYAKASPHYSDFASGRVFYSLPGHPAFPVRLASEIFQRCVTSRESIYKNSTPCTLYDPCCGAAYHLSVLAYLHGEHIREVIGSDIDEKAVALARRNLELLSIAGLDKRISEISRMFELYNKDSHQDALKSTSILKNRLTALTEKYSLSTRVFQASATDSETISKNIKTETVDVVFTDVPYGQHSYWHEATSNKLLDPLGSMLNGLIGILSPSSIVAIVSDKQQKASHKSFQRVEQFQIGKRRVVLLKPI